MSDGSVYVAWMGTSPDNTDIFLAQSSNDGNSFNIPENLSNDPDISYNPILSVNGTHVFVEWTDQDDSGHTQIKSKTLPHTTVVSQNNAESYAELSGDLNSTVSSSALLQGQNSTYVGNESRTEIQTENMSEAVTLNRPTLASDWDPSSLSSNSNSSLVPSFEPMDTTTIHESKLDNHTEIKNVDIVDPTSFSGKLLADKTEGKMNSKINGTRGFLVEENSQPEADTNTNSGAEENPAKIRVDWMAALTAAEEALKIKESQKMDHNTGSNDKTPITSTMGEEKKTIQLFPTKEQKRAESVAPLQPNPTSRAESISVHDILAVTSRHNEAENLNHTHLNSAQGANKVQPEQADKDRQQQKETQQQRSKEKAMVAKDKPVGTSPLPRFPFGEQNIESVDRSRASRRRRSEKNYQSPNTKNERSAKNYGSKKN